MYERMKRSLKEIIAVHHLEDQYVRVKVKKLKKVEALGNPEHDDYPLLKGKEALLQAEYLGSVGVAFTDMPYDHYEQRLSTILNLELKNNFQRAVFLATLNAVLKHLKLVENTEHCRNEGLTQCASKLKEYIESNHRDPKVLLVGYQPRFAEVITENFNSRIIDLDADNLGKKINDVVIESVEKTKELVRWANLLFVTSSSFVNGTAEQFLVPDKKTIFYGVSGAGCTYLLNLERYCQQGN